MVDGGGSDRVARVMQELDGLLDGVGRRLADSSDLARVSATSAPSGRLYNAITKHWPVVWRKRFVGSSSKVEARDMTNPSNGTENRRRRRMGAVSATLVFGVALLAVAWLVPLLPLDRDELTVTFSQGAVMVETADGSTVEVTEGTTIGPGERVVVPEGASVSLSAVDGHDFRLTDESTLGVGGSRGTLLGGRTDTRMDVTRGEVRVSGDGRPRTSMDIGLPNGVAGVRGTVFEIKVGQADASISVHEGVVALTDTPGEPVELVAGQGAILTADGPVVREVPAAPVIYMPESGPLIRARGTLITWSTVPRAASYLIEFASDEGFQQVRSRLLADTAAVEVPILELDIPLFVRVQANTSGGLGGLPSDPEPMEIALHWAQGLDLQAQGDLSGSLAEFDLARARFPDDARLLQDIGWTFYLMGRHNDARDVYEQGREIDPENIEIVLQLGRAYFWLLDYPSAIAAYQSVLEGTPNDDDALWGLADTYRAQGRLQEALVLVELALRVNPDHPYARETLRQIRGGT